MGSERSVLWSVCLVLTLFIAVAIINYVVILHVKLEFDLCCQQVFWHCEENEGLQAKERDALMASLTSKGFESVVIKAPVNGSISKGEKVMFSVTAKKEVSTCMALLKTEKIKQDFVYKQFIVGRRIVN